MCVIRVDVLFIFRTTRHERTVWKDIWRRHNRCLIVHNQSKHTHNNNNSDQHHRHSNQQYRSKHHRHNNNQRKYPM